MGITAFFCIEEIIVIYFLAGYFSEYSFLNSSSVSPMTANNKANVVKRC